MNNQAEFLQGLEAWFAREIARLYDKFPDNMHGIAQGQAQGLVLGCPLWGEPYIARFGYYCLPTIVAPKNLAALSGRGRLVIFTDQDGWNPLRKMLGPLRSFGLDWALKLMPPDVMDNWKKAPNNKYWLLGTTQSLLVHLCGRYGMGYHMLQPDHLYNEAYFPNLFSLIDQGCEAIAQTGISANIATAKNDIEKFRQKDGELVIPDRDLGDIGWRHMHKQMRMYNMNNAKIPERLPHSHYIYWQGKDRLAIYCCHMNPAFISARLCWEAPIPNRAGMASTIDTKLPMLMKAPVYIPGVDDGLTFIEVSDDTKPARSRYVSARVFAACCHGQVHFSSKYDPFFAQVCEVPIHKQETYVAADKIVAQHKQIMALLKREKGRAAIEAQQAAAGVEVTGE